MCVTVSYEIKIMNSKLNSFMTCRLNFYQKGFFSSFGKSLLIETLVTILEGQCILSELSDVGM